MSAQSTYPARTTVFATTELAENILGNLHSKDLIRFGSTCNEFRGVVQAQLHQFTRESQAELTPISLGQVKSTIRLNPLLGGMFAGPEPSDGYALAGLKGPSQSPVLAGTTTRWDELLLSRPPAQTAYVMVPQAPSKDPPFELKTFTIAVNQRVHNSAGLMLEDIDRGAQEALGAHGDWELPFVVLVDRGAMLEAKTVLYYAVEGCKKVQQKLREPGVDDEMTAADCVVLLTKFRPY